MQAIVQHAYGTIDDVLRLRNIDEPAPRPHEVLVRVHAASVNHADWLLISGKPYVMRAALGLGRPRIAIRGRDLAGRVEAVGAAALAESNFASSACAADESSVPLRYQHS